MSNYETFQQSLPKAADDRIQALLDEIETSRVGQKSYELDKTKQPVLYYALETIVGSPAVALSPENEQHYMHEWSDAYDRLSDDVLKEAGKRWHSYRKKSRRELT